MNVPSGTGSRHRPAAGQPRADDLADRSLAAFVEAGTLDLSLDQLADAVGASKRMLIHYFGTRDHLEARVMTRLEDGLRAQFAADTVPRRPSPQQVVLTLWERATAPEARGVLLLVMDVSRRAWQGSQRARDFYGEQQRLWADMLLPFFPSRHAVEDVLQAFQGAILAYLITGDPLPGRRVLARLARAAGTR